MNSAAYAAYDDESTYDYESPSDPSSPWVFSRTSSTTSESTASLQGEEDEDEDEEDEESSEEDSDTTSPTATLSPTSPAFHPTGFAGPAFSGSFGSPPPESPAPVTRANKTFLPSYSSFTNHPASAPRIRLPRPPKPRTEIPPPPVPHPKPPTLTRQTGPYPDVPPKPKFSRPPAPPPRPPPPPPPMTRSKSSTISHLRDAISSLETQMSQLLAQKRDLQTRLEQEVRVQSPVHRLPSELLSSIFVMGVLGVGEEEENPVMLRTIMLVCRQWYELTLDAPKLWSRINVSPHDSLAKAQRRLDRSKSFPLDISINFGPRAEYTTTTTTYTTSTSTSSASLSNTNNTGVSQPAAGVSSSASGSFTSYVSTNPLILNGSGNNSASNGVNANTKTTTTTVNVIDSIIRSMELFKGVLYRTRSFTLRVPNRHQAHAALMRCREYPAPVLEHLTIHIYHSMLDGPSYVSSSGISNSGSEVFSYSGGGGGTNAKLTPFPLFDGHTPLLKTCSFTSFNFGWDPTMLKHLKVIRLGGYFNGHAPTLPALLAVLRECPELEELSLRNLSEGEGDDDGMSGGHHGGACAPSDMGLASRGCGGHGGGSLSALTAESMVGTSASKTIVLPRLHTLTLYYASPAQSLLPLLSLPSLANLTLAFLQNISSILQCLYNQALTKLPLKFIRIESCVFNEITFINLMRRLNGLIKLEMVDVEDLSGGALRNLTALTPSAPAPLPRVTHLTLDGCTSLDFDSLRIFVESRLPPNPHTFKRFHASPKEIVSSASEAARVAEAAKQTRARHVTTSASSSAGGGGGGDMLMHPARLRSVDVTRCTQISKEMVQWLRMYVAEVKCETAKGVWGDT